MKKHTLLAIAAGATFAFAACNTGENNTTKAQMDSTVNARVDTMQNNLQAKNDSAINAAARMRADSMMRADSVAKAAGMKTGAAAEHKAAKEIKHTTTTVKTPTVEKGGLGSQSDQHQLKNKKSVEGGGLGSQSDQQQVKDKKSVEGGGLGSQADQKH